MQPGLMTGLNYTRVRPGYKQQTLKQGIMQDVNQMASQLYTPMAYMTPGVGDYMAHQDATEKYDKAKSAFGKGNYLQAALYGGGGLADDLTTVPVLGDFAMAAKGMGSVAGGLMTAYHGTPHKFLPTKDNPLGEFDLAKMGTGEGAQAYGHGIYLAENPGVAKSYQANVSFQHAGDGSSFTEKGADISQAAVKDRVINRLSKEDATPEQIEAIANDILQGIDPTATTPNRISAAKAGNLPEKYQKLYKSALDETSDITVNQGSLYDVDLPDEHIERMLDWDAPLSEQPEGVRKALEKELAEQVEKTKRVRDGFNAKLRAAGQPEKVFKKEAGLNGKQLYEKISKEQGGQEAASEYLKSLGIPGLKYFDGSSRAAGEGTRNYVVFDPSITKILDRNGTVAAKAAKIAALRAEANANRFGGGKIIMLEFTNITVAPTLVHGGYIVLVGAVNYAPAAGGGIVLYTSGNGTWRELSRF